MFLDNMTECVHFMVYPLLWPSTAPAPSPDTSLVVCAGLVIVTSFCISSTDEKEGLAVSLKESSQLIEEAKEREVQMQNKLKAMEQQVKVLTERDQEVRSASKLQYNSLRKSGSLYCGNKQGNVGNILLGLILF